MASAEAVPPEPRVAGVDLQAKFENYDTREVYEKVKKHGLDSDARNFVVTFGGPKAEVALDLSACDFETLLQMNNNNTEMPVRWM